MNVSFVHSLFAVVVSYPPGIDSPQTGGFISDQTLDTTGDAPDIDVRAQGQQVSGQAQQVGGQAQQVGGQAQQYDYSTPDTQLLEGEQQSRRVLAPSTAASEQNRPIDY